jgi:peptidyl-prolyl cis-trans isomerase SurA
MAVLAVLAAGGAGAAWAQMQVPRYQGPFSQDRPQFAIPTTPAKTPDGTVVEDVIVRVNDQIIDRSDYERGEQELAASAQQKSMSAADLEEAQKNLLRDMIDKQLLLSRGKELDINADAEVVRRLDTIRKQYNFDSMEALEKAVRDSGISFEDWKAGIRDDVITQQVVSEEVGRKLQLTTKEEQAYYDAHKKDFEEPEQVRLSEILIPTPDNPSDAQVAQAKAKADEVEAKLKAGTSFEALAKEYSGGPNADTGGDLEYFKRGALPKVLEDQTFPLKVGEWTAPIRTLEGYVVLKVTEHQEAHTPPLSAIDEQVKEAIYQEAIAPAVRTYLTKLREDAYIDIAPGFVDTGASAKQTKPVYAPYVAPGTTTKKAEEKQRLERMKAAPAAKVATGSGAKPGAVASAAAGGTVASGAAGSAGTPSAAGAKVKTVSVATKKPKKFHREKVRYGQAPRNSLPVGPEETLAAGADQGAGGVAAATGTAAPPSEEANLTPDADPFGAKMVERKKTRYSDRVEEAKPKTVQEEMKAAAKASSPLTPEERAQQQAQTAPLGLGGDTATKKKPVKDKNAPKERLEDKTPAPAAAKPEPTPSPPKSVRENGEPVVSPAPDPSTLPPVTVPASATPAATAPATSQP